MMGLHNIHISRNFPAVFDFLFSLPVILLWYCGYKKSNNRPFLFILGGVYFVFFVWLRWITPNYYDYNKAVTYSLFIFISLLIIGISSLFEQSKYHITKYLFVLAMIFLTLRSAKKMHD